MNRFLLTVVALLAMANTALAHDGWHWGSSGIPYYPYRGCYSTYRYCAPVVRPPCPCYKPVCTCYKPCQTYNPCWDSFPYRPLDCTCNKSNTPVVVTVNVIVNNIPAATVAPVIVQPAPPPTVVVPAPTPARPPVEILPPPKAQDVLTDTTEYISVQRVEKMTLRPTGGNDFEDEVGIKWRVIAGQKPSATGTLRGTHQRDSENRPCFKTTNGITLVCLEDA